MLIRFKNATQKSDDRDLYINTDKIISVDLFKKKDTSCMMLTLEGNSEVHETEPNNLVYMFNNRQQRDDAFAELGKILGGITEI